MKKGVLLRIIGVMIAVSALADTHFELLKSVGLTVTSINWVKLFGLIMALLLPSISLTKNLNKDEEPDNIGGGGIKNPKP